MPAGPAKYRSIPDSLVHAFTHLWDLDDVSGMYAMLMPDAVFDSPFSTWVGRDSIRARGLLVIPQTLHDTRSEERYSSVDGDDAYSVGALFFKEFDRQGRVGGQRRSDYLMVFVHKPDGWKVRAIVFQRERADTTGGKNAEG
jgi:hypothetical protein